MKGFERKDPWLSLCGLNCGLCPMLWGKYCGGCGNGNQSCAIARCSLEQGAVAYCFECAQYPCERYQNRDDFDVFITGRNRKADFQKAQRFGLEAYHREQAEKAKILDIFLSRYNDGRKKTLFFIAANLLELPELQAALSQAERKAAAEALPLKEKSAFIAGLLVEAAASQNISLKLRRKKRK